MPNRIVLCLDGTWNSTFQKREREDGTSVLKPSNALKLARAVVPVDATGVRQTTYYDSGVGALGLYPGLSNRLLNFVDSKLGGAWGAGFEANVEQAANFLANNYSEQSEVFVFGYSRGAAQARALTRFLDWLGGIPEKRDAYFIPLFFREYIATRGEGSPTSVVSERTGDKPHERLLPFSIKFLGVWDTVMALGSRFRASQNNAVQERSFHVGDTPASCVVHARQALAIDEKRYDFRPEIWRATAIEKQSLMQRWFPGTHGNVGGAFGNDGLANSALHWIADEAKECGLAVDDAFLKHYRAFAQDSIGSSYKGIYPILEALRFRLGKGTRALTLEPNSAGFSISSSAVQRLCSEASEFETMSENYRPAGLVKHVRQNVRDWSKFVSDLGLDPSEFLRPVDL